MNFTDKAILKVTYDCTYYKRGHWYKLEYAVGPTIKAMIPPSDPHVLTRFTRE
jgi:hypothetical protein